MKRPALVPRLALTLTLALLPIGAGADPLSGSPTLGTPVGMAAPSSPPRRAGWQSIPARVGRAETGQ